MYIRSVLIDLDTLIAVGIQKDPVMVTEDVKIFVDTILTTKKVNCLIAG